MRLFCSVLFFLLSVSCVAQTIDEATASQRAALYVNGKALKFAKASRGYYIFTIGYDEGFVIISAQKETSVPLLGLSEQSGWHEDEMPPTLLAWLDKIDRRPLIQTGTRSQTRAGEGREDVPILLTTHWHQSAPYNDLTPYIEDGHVKTAAGCVAVATAQIVYYWRKDNPSTTSYDTPVYPYGKAPVTYSIPAGTKMEWELMHDSYTLKEPQEDREAVARLVYLLGTSTYLNYGVSTGGHIQDIINPIYQQFKLNGTHVRKLRFSQEAWEDLLYMDLQKKQPILYGGSNGSGGHAVVVDGYRSDLNLFHFNFGWGGRGDGYYTVDDETGMDGYNEDQGCVYGICPTQRNVSITVSYPEGMYEDEEVTASVALTNNSTLDIHDLYLFVSKGASAPTDLQKAQGHVAATIPNDGTPQETQITFTPNVASDKCFFFLTDENLSVLSTTTAKVFKSGTAISSVEIPAELILRKSGAETLVITTSSPTRVNIRTCAGVEVFSSVIDGVKELPLPHGLYIINQKKWLQ